jgi:Methyltransferase domain
MPLGVGLAKELKALQFMTGASSRMIVNEIVCTDYSKTVIEIMNKLYCDNSSNGLERNETDLVKDDELKLPTVLIDSSNDVALQFTVADARFLPFPNGSFEFILEKGTLDAMLSDADCGLSNCIQTVTECARVLTPNMMIPTVPLSLQGDEPSVESKTTSSSRNGCLLLVSHLNANTAKGMSWLNDVVVTGLLEHSKEDPLIEWEIEVHGKSKGDKKYDPSSNDLTESLGPAVYVIHKRMKESNLTLHPIEANDLNDDMNETIPIEFFSY